MRTQDVMHLKVVGGDSKLDLFAQLQDIGRLRSHVRPTFVVRVKHLDFGTDTAYDAGLLINGVFAVDGSGNCWIITGYIAEAYAWMSPGTERMFKGFYDTKTRKGFLNLGH